MNIANDDERCFGYAMLFFLDKPQDQHRHYGRPELYTEEMFEANNLADLPYPIAPQDVHLYEDRLLININVFSYADDEGKDRYPMFISSKHYPREANLFYWKEHYAPISDISRLFGDFTRSRQKHHMCTRCLGFFTTADILARHKQLCTRTDFMSVLHLLPAPDTEYAHIKFSAFKNSTRAPFVIYADFESILRHIDNVNKATRLIQKHEICAAAALLVSNNGDVPSRYAIFAGKQTLTEFLNKLIEWERECIDYLKHMFPMRLTRAQEEAFDRATECYLCRHPFTPGERKGDKVRDHDHLTGKFLGAAHNLCNIKRPVVYQIPVFFHNFRGYDSHLIVHAFQQFQDREIRPIGQNMEKYLQVAWGKHMVFRDSLQFLNSSLDNLVKSLAKTGRNNFYNLHRFIPQYFIGADDEHLQLLERKGVFCYDYIDSFERLNERQLPPREQFFNKLSGQECSEEDYAHAQNVWEDFQCETLTHYMGIYLLTDVLLLADVFQNFRNASLAEYQLDPVYFVSAPHLAWNALLKYIDRPIHLITDPEMYRMIQPSIRGGICHVSVRFARANNKLMGSLYDPTKPTSYILYVDANNLYGWAMSQPLPDNDFTWLSNEECRDAETALRVKYTRDHFFTQQQHYILEVDLEYPPELHERDDDYPLAPETMTIEQHITGQKQHELRAKYFGAACPHSRKLICSFLPKKHYVVLGHLLRFYLDRGLKLVKVHRGIKFTATPYFAPYIAHNSQRRKENKDDPTKKDFYKLINNAPYGKTIENVARRSDIRLCNDMNKARKLSEKPHCIDWRVFDEQLVGVEMRKIRANINKPFQHGFCVLEWSKLKMYNFYALLRPFRKQSTYAWY